ncbi:MAG: 50S ribosomal protein L23 [Planctomycetia bacterium]|nr:50S ribosomal protein L23 [Planctomycetia bacterium]
MTEIISAGILLEPYQVIIRPLVTEKGLHKAERTNGYAFQVHPDATKDDIRQAVESLFDVKVTRVNTQNRKGKTRRYKQKTYKTKAWKKAIVFLHDDYRIDFF